MAIAEKYRHLIHQDSQFIAASQLDINIDANGLRFEAASPEKWLQGGVRVLAGKQKEGQPLTHYPLYKDISHAQVGITDANLAPTLTLSSERLPNINAGSVVLYRQYEVGKILDVRPKNNTFEIDVFIYPKYQTLLTHKSVFWVESAAKVDNQYTGGKYSGDPNFTRFKRRNQL